MSRSYWLTQMPVIAAPPSFSGALSLMVPHPVHLQGFSLSYWPAAPPVKSLTVLVGDSPQSPPFSRRLADGHHLPQEAGGVVIGWSPRPARRRRRRRGLEVWLSSRCLSVPHRLGPDGGDGAPGTELMEPTRAEAEVRRGAQPGRRQRQLGPGPGLARPLERAAGAAPAGLGGALRR